MFANINRVVWVMVVTDFFVNSAFGSFAPIFAIFIADQIRGGSAEVAGFAASVYWITKSVVQLPIARFLDRGKSERRHFYAIFFGFLFSAFTPFAYNFITEPWQLYAVQAFLGIAMAWAVPAWYSIFTHHVDKWRVSFEWSLESVFSVGVATAISTAVGGYVAERFGFDILFTAAGTLAVLSSFLLLFMRDKLLPHPPEGITQVLPERHHHRH